MTVNNIKHKIIDLTDKVRGVEGVAGVPLKINGTEIGRFSHQVAKVYRLLNLIEKSTSDKEKLELLGDILQLAKNECSVFTSNSTSLGLRHPDVCQFFETMNEMLIVKLGEQINLVLNKIANDSVLDNMAEYHKLSLESSEADLNHDDAHRTPSNEVYNSRINLAI